MFTAGFKPVIVQLDEISDVECNEAAVFGRGKGKLAVIRQSSPSFFQCMNRIVAAFAESLGQWKMDVFVEKQAQGLSLLHAASGARWRKRRRQ